MKGWKTGVLSESITNGYDQTLFKGQTVQYKKFKSYEKEHGEFRLRYIWRGTYQWHYYDHARRILIRSSKLIIQ